MNEIRYLSKIPDCCKLLYSTQFKHVPKGTVRRNFTSLNIRGIVVFTNNSKNGVRKLAAIIPQYVGGLSSRNDCFSAINRLNVRFLSEKKNKDSSDQKQLIEAWKNPYEGLTLGDKVKEASKDVTYTGVIILGVGITAIMFYAIGRELLSKESPNAVFGEALKRCKNDVEVQVLLGEPIKGYGEESGRRRRKHVSHVEFDVGEVKHMRMKFYIEGPHRKATVNLEKKQNEKGKYEYRYLFVQAETYPHQVVILEDNR